MSCHAIRDAAMQDSNHSSLLTLQHSLQRQCRQQLLAAQQQALQGGGATSSPNVGSSRLSKE